MAGSRIAWPADVPLDYVLGREKIEQYVGHIQAGRLQPLPLAYDLIRHQWFDLFAGTAYKPEDWLHWTNRGMNANARCLECHTTGYEKGYQPDSDNYQSHWHEIGVGCEACHGPGADHVRARKAHALPDPYRSRDRTRLLESCADCHSRRINRAASAPDQPFLDRYEPELLDTDAYYPDGQVKEELYEAISFQMSRMYARGVRCWHCHDPHRGGTRADGNALCLRCHAARYADLAHTHHRTGPGTACVGCHMPVTIYMQRDPRHDHAFTRPDPELTLTLGVPNACNRCHTDRDARWASELVRAWFPDDAERSRRRELANAIADARAGEARTVPHLLELLQNRHMDAVRRSSAARLLARFPTSEGVTEALVRATRDGEALVRLGATWSLAQRSPPAGAARDALLAALGDPFWTVRTAAVLGLRGTAARTLPADVVSRRFAKAAVEWRESQERQGDTPEGHYNLALFDVAQGDTAAAEREYRTALRLWPRSYQTRHNLGMLLAEEGRLSEAEAQFRAVLATDLVPETAFALGLLLGQQQRWADAVAALEQCLEADPAYPRARYNLGLAYAKVGDIERAFDALEASTVDGDSHADAVHAILDLARQTGDRRRTEQWVTEAARLERNVQDNPHLRELLAPGAE